MSRLSEATIISSMRVAVIRHVPFEDVGLIGEVLSEAGLPYDYIDMNGNDVPTLIASYAALISMGGPMSANDNLPFLRQELDWIRSAVAEGKPVLGICLGAQMIAKALGGRVCPNPVKEIGWFPVFWTEAVQGDSLFAGFRQPELVFHWHGETFDLPDGTVLLAYSEGCRHQAFRFGSNVYGLQFHLEVTPEMVGDWLQQPANCADVVTLDQPVDPDLADERLFEVGRQVFRRWCNLVSRRGTSQPLLNPE